MSAASLQARLDTALDLAERGGEMAMSMRPEPGSAHARMKGPQDWVTEADSAVERFLSDELAAAFPADGFQGEEGGIARGGSLRWVIDPIDGTSNYARGGARFCVSIACLEGDTPLIGVIAAPALRETLWAWRGGGAWLNGDPVHAADTRDVKLAIMEVGWSRVAATPTTSRSASASSLTVPACAMAGPVRWASPMSPSGGWTVRRTAHQPVGRGGGADDPAGGRGQGQ